MKYFMSKVASSITILKIIRDILYNLLLHTIHLRGRMLETQDVKGWGKKEAKLPAGILEIITNQFSANTRNGSPGGNKRSYIYI